MMDSLRDNGATARGPIRLAVLTAALAVAACFGAAFTVVGEPAQASDPAASANR